MALNDRLITVAIHTCERALALKDKLERAGLYVTLQNINLEHPVVASGMRVRIYENDLAKALLIIEGDDSAAADNNPETSINTAEILVPVDFSPYSLEAVLVGCNLALIHNATVTILNTYYTPLHAATTQLSDALTYDRPTTDSSAEAADLARQQMEVFRRNLLRKLPVDRQKKLHIKEIISRGIPEEVIGQYCKEHSPMLIVMGTRGADKKNKDLVGSVTAEVLDTCRRPVLTIPEGFTADEMAKLSKVLYFCYGEQCDILAIQRLHELTGEQYRQITLAHLQAKRSLNRKDTLASLSDYCSEHFPKSRFSTAVVSAPESEETCGRIEREKEIGLIALPNKRKSAFARLFNPGIAHRLLFKADIPMMVIPV